MKRLFVAILMVLFVLSVPANAFEPGEWATNSGQKTADTKILTGAGYLYGIMVVTDGTNAVTVDVYDNTAGSGTLAVPSWTVTTSATDRAQFLPLNIPVGVDNGIYVDITTAGTVKYNVFYRAQ
jgi:hypothetical protein